MSYIRRGDIMIHSTDLSKPPSNFRLDSNTNHYDSMDASISESNEHYATLGRQQRNTIQSCGSLQCHRSNTNSSQIPYTRYIRPCNNIHELNGQNSDFKPYTDTDANSFANKTRTRKKRGNDRSKIRKKKVLFSFVCGLVIGLVISSVVWLTVDRLKENKIICEFYYKSKSEINKNEGTTISTQKAVESTTQNHVTVAGGSDDSSVANVSSSLSTKHTETTNSVPVFTLFTKTTVSAGSSVSPTNQLSSRKQSSMALVTEKTTKATLSRLISTRLTDTASTSSTPHSSTGKESIVSKAMIISSKKTEEPSSNLADGPFSSTTPPKASSFASKTDENDQTTSSSQSSTQPSQTSSMTSSVSNTLSTKQKTLYKNKSKQTTISSGNINKYSSVLTTQDSLTAYSSTLVLSASTPVLTSAESYSSTTVAPENVDKRSVQGGYVYVRWGSLSCKSQSEQMYKGYVAGGHYQHRGGATNTLCLPEVPTWGNYSDNLDADRALVYGTEYGSSDSSFTETTGLPIKYKDVPCSVCQATGRLSHVMIPGKSECFPGWTLEYKGYIMGSGYIHHASELICVDSSPDYVTGTGGFNGGKFLYLAEVRTGTLPSPPFVNGRELACVVCTL